MGGFLFGECGCCRNSLVGETQVATAYAPYWMGYTRLEADGSAWPNWLGLNYYDYDNGYFPLVVYLTYRRVYSVNGQSPVEEYYKWDIYGGLTSHSLSGAERDEIFVALGAGFGPGKATDTVNELGYANGSIVITLEDPYTYAEATANAVALLGNIDLLNPARIYPIASYYTVDPWHFCYASEYSVYPSPYATNHLSVTWNADGSLNYAPDEGLFSEAQARKGWLTAYVGQTNKWRFAGNVIAEKSAVRTPTGFKSRGGSVAVFSPAGGTFQGVPPAPVAIPPGEHLFDPSDLAGSSAGFWSSTPPPPLGS